ncbi:DinB family protein [Pedobacter hiemivivus]|uniref:DinB family protein n=1 Tax=Pedobacter hiemivivus TaxID=2530454 RepID=A0A4R0MMB0_9SPHI|nr:DinB family protein [Pedobacter hiemivivus]TCC87859.1 DinB family protein [Pedobacter hiemivivus]
MLKESLKSLFTRDLNKLKSEIEQYQKEENLWIVDKGISNSAGNLCLHLVGNLNTFIGAELGKTGYVRNRELEFSLKDVPRAELLVKVEDTIKAVNTTLDGLSEGDLMVDYPLVKIVAGGSSVGFMLIHLSTHLAYHLGQINYHRRLLDI